MKKYASIKSIFQNRFFRSTGSLISGTVFAQILTMLALPFLTRMYSAEDFEFLGVYVAVLSLIAVVSSLRFEIAIPIPEDDTEAANLLALSLILTTGFALLCIGILALLADALSSASDPYRIKTLRWLLPLGVLLSGYYAALQYWSMRKKRFTEIAKTRITQMASGLMVQFSMGWYGLSAIGLPLGHAVMGGMGAGGLALRTWYNEKNSLKKISIIGMINAFKKNRKYPLYSTWEGLATVASSQAPILIIASFSISPEAGYFMLALRVLGAPLQIVGSAISQVYLSHAPESKRNGKLRELTMKVALSTSIFVALPVVIIAVLGDLYFELIFGSGWGRSGEILIWLAPLFAIRSVATPISMVMNVVGMQREMLLMKVVGMVLRVGSVVIAVLFFNESVVEVYAISSALVFTAYALVFIRASRS